MEQREFSHLSLGGKPVLLKPVAHTDMMSVLVYHHDLMQTCRLLQIPAPWGNDFINRKLTLCHAIFFASSWRTMLSLYCRTKIQQQQYKTCHYNAFCHLNSLSSLVFLFVRQPKSHIHPWIILTFHFHNSPLLLFFLSTGFKSQAGAWERKTVCWNLCIVFPSPLSKL